VVDDDVGGQAADQRVVLRQRAAIQLDLHVPAYRRDARGDLRHIVPLHKRIGQHVAARAANAGRVEALQFAVGDVGLDDRNPARLRSQVADGIGRAAVVVAVGVGLDDDDAFEARVLAGPCL
jgi:hypothetical protein